MIVIYQSTLNGTGTVPVPLIRPTGFDNIRVQIDFAPGTSGTIEVFSRIDPSLGWVSLGTFTANTVLSLGYVEYLRADLTGVAGGGAVTVGVAQ